MTAPLRVIVSVLGSIAIAPAQAAITPSPASEAAARVRLEKALTGLAQRGALAVELCWQQSVRNVLAAEIRASGTCSGEVLHLHHANQEWLISARNDLVRVDDAWLGPKHEGRGCGFVPGIAAALKRCAFEVLRREAGVLEDRPVETFTLRVPIAAAMDLLSLTRPPLLQQSSATNTMRGRLTRAAAAPDGDSPLCDVAVTIDPAVQEIRAMRVRFTLLPDGEAAAEPTEWQDGLAVRSPKAILAIGVQAQFKPAAPGAMPQLDMDLRTRLRLQ
jgi:hypothetical protein